MAVQLNSKVFPSVAPSSSEFVASNSIVAIAPAKQKVWVALTNGGIEVRDAYSGEVCHFFEPPKRSTDAVRAWCLLSVCKDPSDLQTEEMWVGLSTGTIEIYSCCDYSTIRQLRKHISGIYCLTSDSSNVFAGSSDFTITQWRIADGQLLRVYTGHANYVRCLYAEGYRLFSGSDDQSIRIWDSLTGECKRVLTFHSRSGGVTALCRVGATMWSGDSCGVLARWTLTAESALISISSLHSSCIISIELVGSHVYVSFTDGTTMSFFAVTGELDNRFSHGGSRLSAVRCVAEIDRMYVWSGAGDNTLRCWHHDQSNTMTAERQRTNDMKLFYSTQRPYVERNRESVEQLQNLRELCALADGGEKAIQAAIVSKHVEMMSKAAQALILASKINGMNKEFADHEEECRKLKQLRLEKQRGLETLQRKLRNLETAVQTLTTANPDVIDAIRKWAKASNDPPQGVSAQPPLPQPSNAALLPQPVLPALPSALPPLPPPPPSALPPPPASALPPPPASALPPPPASALPPPPASALPPPPASAVPPPPTSAVPPPPPSALPLPPTSAVPPPPTSGFPPPAPAS